MRPWSAFFCAALAGCYGFPLGFRGDDDDDAGDDDSGDDDTGDDDTGDDDTGDDDTGDDDTQTAPFRALGIDPDAGSAEGGYTARIEFSGDAGTDDEDDVSVRFGTQTAEVLAITDDEIVVTVPPGCVAGDVDVTVDVPSGDDAVDFEFERWAEGLDGAVFGLYRTWTPVLGSETGSAELGFFEPTTAPPLTHLPPLGGCAFSVPDQGLNRSYYSVGPSLTLSGGGSSVLGLGSGNRYTGSLPAQALPFSSSFSVGGATDPDGCPVTLPAAIQSPPALTVTDPDLTRDDQCWRVDLGFALIEWAGPHQAQDRVIVNILANPSNPADGQVICHLQDTGTYVLDDTYMLGLAWDAWNVIQITRYRMTVTEQPRSGAKVYGIYSDTISGTIFVDYFSNICG